MRVESEGEGGMKVATEREVMEEEDTTVPAEGSREKGVNAVTKGRGEMETALLMMAARTLQRLLVREAEEGSHMRERRELVNLEEGGGGRHHPL